MLLDNNIPHASLPNQVNYTSPVDHPSTSAKTMPAPSRTSKSSKISSLHMRSGFTSFLSNIYTEFTSFWLQENWLTFTDNHKETFLNLNRDITGCSTIQMAIDNKYFSNRQLPLLEHPECLLIRKEPTSKSLILPSANISFQTLVNKHKRASRNFCQAKLIAIICNLEEINAVIMFYKHSPKNQWYMFYNDGFEQSQSYSQRLSNEEESKLESILTQNDCATSIDLSQLPFPLSALFTGSVIYVYLAQRITNDKTN